MSLRVLIVDCYDSFTFNLYQQVGKLGANPVVLPCDTSLDVLKKPDATGLSCHLARARRRIPASALKCWKP